MGRARGWEDAGGLCGAGRAWGGFVMQMAFVGPKYKGQNFN